MFDIKRGSPIAEYNNTTAFSIDPSGEFCLAKKKNTLTFIDLRNNKPLNFSTPELNTRMFGWDSDNYFYGITASKLVGINLKSQTIDTSFYDIPHDTITALCPRDNWTLTGNTKNEVLAYFMKNAKLPQGFSDIQKIKSFDTQIVKLAAMKNLAAAALANHSIHIFSTKQLNPF